MSVLVQAKETEVFARLRDILVTDVDPRTIHKKVENTKTLYQILYSVSIIIVV